MKISNQSFESSIDIDLDHKLTNQIERSIFFNRLRSIFYDRFLNGIAARKADLLNFSIDFIFEISPSLPVTFVLYVHNLTNFCRYSSVQFPSISLQFYFKFM